MTDASKNIAFIGIGKMGLPMSVLVAKAGYAVTAFDQSAARISETVKAMQRYAQQVIASGIAWTQLYVTTQESFSLTFITLTELSRCQHV